MLLLVGMQRPVETLLAALRLADEHIAVTRSGAEKMPDFDHLGRIGGQDVLGDTENLDTK